MCCTLRVNSKSMGPGPSRRCRTATRFVHLIDDAIRGTLHGAKDIHMYPFPCLQKHDITSLNCFSGGLPVFFFFFSFFLGEWTREKKYQCCIRMYWYCSERSQEKRLEGKGFGRRFLLPSLNSIQYVLLDGCVASCIF